MTPRKKSLNRSESARHSKGSGKTTSNETLAQLQRENSQLLSQLREAVEHQTATAEVLQVIKSSPGNLASVFDTLLEKATDLCGAKFGTFIEYDGKVFRVVAGRNLPPAYAAAVSGQAFTPDANVALRHLLDHKASLHLTDMAADQAYAQRGPLRAASVELGGVRSMLAVPLLKTDDLIGVLAIYRDAPGGFADNQIALVSAFANQAMIAIENARLLTEQRESLEQQTATAEILETINRAQGDLQPVFDAIVDKAMALCDAAFGMFNTFDGERFNTVATRGVPEAYARYRASNPLDYGPDTGPGRLIAGEDIAHTADLTEEDVYRSGEPNRRAVVDLGGARTILNVALRKEGKLLGMIATYRQEVRPFDDKQIALLQSFAAQAVIAMENARLMTETREALEQQTATAEVLQVINSSPGNLEPVFAAILEKAMHICSAAFGGLWTFDGDRYVAAALHGVPKSFADFLRESTTIPGPGTAPYRFLHGERSVIQNIDLADEEPYRAGDPVRRALVDLGGARSALQVPLCKDDSVIGVVTIYRQEVRGFSEKQIALLENFAAQAVIAMENARLLGELRQRTDDLTESLEYQTATSEVLSVISRSTTDLEPVLDAMLAAASRLCGVQMGGVAVRRGDVLRYVATTGVSDEFNRHLRRTPHPFDRSTAAGRAAVERAVAHIPDVEADREYALPQTTTIGNMRALLAVPLLREDEVVGTITLGRSTPGQFSDRQIALVRTFADQAVIAMENTRLLSELRERTDDLTESLEYQTATSELLEVISRSASDIQPVFETMLAAAERLCDAENGGVAVRSGDVFRYAITRQKVPEMDAILMRRDFAIDRTTLIGRTALEGQVVHIVDVDQDPEYAMPETAQIGGVRTILGVPLTQNEQVVGVIVLTRRKVEPFTERQIALVRTFADQAVIAMENARLLTEQREALEQQTATTEVLEVINASPGELQPVFDTMLERAVRLTDSAFGMMNVYEERRFRLVASHGVPDGLRELWTTGPPPPGPQNTLTRLINGEDVVHVEDMAEYPSYHEGDPRTRGMVELGGARSLVVVGMRKDGALLGSITTYRQEVRPFTDKQVALLQNFAAQAVIAMENARLLSEQREALEQQTATAEVLAVINASPGDLAPVFETILEKAHALCRVANGSLQLYDGTMFRAVAVHNVPEALARRLREGYVPGANMRRLIDGADFAHFPDIAEVDDPTARATAAAGIRTLLTVALRKDGKLLGQIVAVRREVQPFADKEIALLQGFAAQAVVAMENARLLGELTRREEELRVTFDHMGDGVVMFDADLRLASWNRNFQELLDIPDSFVTSRPGLQDYVRLLVGRGELGDGDAEQQIATYRERASRQWSTERTRPDGRVIEVRNNPVPGGGAVLIYSDITERKKAEAEIAAARDAAEAALERQTATADILKVIASSPTDVQPVLDAVAKAAQRFCGAADAVISLREDDEFIRAAHEGSMPSVLGRSPLDRSSISGCAIMDGRTIHIPDIGGLDRDELAATQTLAAQSGARAAIAAPMLREGVAVGCILLRRTSAGPFGPEQIELLEAFAAQAVIAIENVRLFTELREALEQQTATADILRVISQSPTDVTPVLTAVAKAALKFCGARDAQVVLRDGDRWFVAATEGSIGIIPGPRPLNRHTTPGRAILDGKVVQIADVQSAEADEFPESRDNAARLGFRSALAAPLLRDAVSIGAIALRRPEPGAFTLNQVELLKSFAAQAVIAIENVRLFTELRDSLERLRAAQANLVQSEKMASLGQLTAGIAHEIKNPLNFVNNFAGLSVELLDELKDAAGPALATLDGDKRAELDETMQLLVGNLQKITEHGKRADGIVKSMLSHSRGGSGDWTPSDINALVEEALNLAYHGARAQDKEFNVTLERDFEKAGKPIEVVPQDVTRVFLNLFGNGFYAANKRRLGAQKAGFKPTLKVSTRDLGEAVEVRVRDNGIGIPPEAREKLFQPFFTTKPTGEGTGLGLSISYDIVTQQHGGTIEVESEVGNFTEFTVRLPRGRRTQPSESVR
jgi:GAF domain-containing protein